MDELRREQVYFGVPRFSTVKIEDLNRQMSFEVPVGMSLSLSRTLCREILEKPWRSQKTQIYDSAADAGRKKNISKFEQHNMFKMIINYHNYFIIYNKRAMLPIHSTSKYESTLQMI